MHGVRNHIQNQTCSYKEDEEEEEEQDETGLDGVRPTGSEGVKG